ncbi:MAG: hypothetical protein ACK53Y_05805, partial [bacterium]
MLTFLFATGPRVFASPQQAIPNASFVETCAPLSRARAINDFRAIAQHVSLALCRSRQGGHKTAVNVWESFCNSMAIDPTL